MSKRLYLLRHAKSSWKQPELADHDRPLAGRGRRAAKAIARHLEENDIAVDVVLCSTARRARETLERVEPVLGDPTVRYEEKLYGASADGLRTAVRDLPDGVAAAMLIGHNPALEQFARELARPADRFGDKFPTAALATFEIAGPRWRDLDRGGAELVGYVRPRDLAS